MPDNPGFVVDPDGNVRDVRGQSEAQDARFSPQPPGPGSSTPGRDGFTRSTQRTPGGFIFIPIGLIITLIIAVLRNCGGPAQKNTYPESDVSLLNSGLFSYDEGDYKTALVYFDMVIRSQPKMGEAYNDRGLAYSALGETDKALADFNQAIQLIPNPGIAYSNRGGLLLSLGNHAQALADLDKAIELSPHLAMAYQNRGLTYLDLGNYDQAIADFNQAIEITPEFPFSAQATQQSRTPVGKSLAGSGSYTSLLNRQTYADLPTVYASRAMAYLHQGDYAKAAADLEKATQLGIDPGYAQQVEALLSVPAQEPQPISMLVPQTGHWQGNSTLLGIPGKIAFEIGADGQIHDFILGLMYPSASYCEVVSQNVLLQPDGTFSFAFYISGVEHGILTQGKFESSTLVSGSFDGYIQCITASGEHLQGGQMHGDSWTAQWVTGPGQTPAEESPSGQPASTGTSVDPGAANITALVIDPRTPATLYAGTSAGVFKSTDAGGQWRSVNAGLPATQINVLVIDLLDLKTIYAGTSTGLYKSTEGAESWTEIDSGIKYPEILTLVVDPHLSSTIYAGTLVGVYKSTDGGKTWIAPRSALAMESVHTLVIDPETPTTLYAGAPTGVYKSLNGGESWFGMNNGLQNVSVHVLAADPLTPGTFYAGTGEGLFKSSDGGQSWDRSLTQPITAFTLDPELASTIHIATSNDGMVTSADGGANWVVIYGIPTVLSVNVLAVDPLISGAIYAGTSKGIFRITDGGANWEALSNGLPN